MRREHAEEARAAVALMQRSLGAAWPGLQARLLVRDDGATATWMETYSRPPPGAGDARRSATSTGDDLGIDTEIEAAVSAAARALDALIEGPRHVEAFAAVA